VLLAHCIVMCMLIRVNVLDKLVRMIHASVCACTWLEVRESIHDCTSYLPCPVQWCMPNRDQSYVVLCAVCYSVVRVCEVRERERIIVLGSVHVVDVMYL
jgi:hypothetical protein